MGLNEEHENCNYFPALTSCDRLTRTGELVIFCTTLAGSGLGFLWFSTYPAQIFMGDIGALALGAALGTLAVIIRHEIVFFIMGGIFVLETASVILQVASYKLAGRRIFRMAPIHHHFELRIGRINALFTQIQRLLTTVESLGNHAMHPEFG